MLGADTVDERFPVLRMMIIVSVSLYVSGPTIVLRKSSSIMSSYVPIDGIGTIFCCQWVATLRDPL